MTALSAKKMALAIVNRWAKSEIKMHVLKNRAFTARYAGAIINPSYFATITITG